MHQRALSTEPQTPCHCVHFDSSILLEAHETKLNTVALKVNTLLFGHRVIIYKLISFLKDVYSQYQVYFLMSKF